MKPNLRHDLTASGALLAISILVFCAAKCQGQDFIGLAQGRNLKPVEVVFQITPLDTIHGESVKLGPGKWLVRLDSAFVWHFGPESKQVERLILHEFGHIYLGLPDGKGIMNPATMGKKVTKREIKKLFR